MSATASASASVPAVNASRASSGTGPHGTERALLLVGLGQAVRGGRTARQLSMRALAELAGVSTRFLVQLEGGSGNISVARLNDVAAALQMPLSALLKDAEDRAADPSLRGLRSKASVISLLGLRGAGKTTIGALVARRLKVPFVELDELIARSAGMELATIFEMHGEGYFRRLEAQTLLAFLARSPKAVLATGGSIAMHPEAYALLRRDTFTVWLKARPQEHWDRVVDQGDARPMTGRPAAMTELRRLLKDRTPLYSQAAHVVDTSNVTIDQAARDIVAAATSRFMEKHA